MTIVIHTYICDDEIGEADAFFDGLSNQLLHAWSQNDASWRSEYMNPLLTSLGIKVQRREPSEDHINQVKEFFGL